MKLCKTCKKLYFGYETICPDCKKKLVEIKEINEPVRLCIAGGTERAMLCGMLKDANIPYVEEPVYPQGVANEIVTGYDVKLSNISIVVPFSALPRAIGLLESLETVSHDLEPYTEEIENEITAIREADKNKEDKQMNPALRTTIKIITAILFLIAIALVVFGTDALTSWFKGLF